MINLVIVKHNVKNLFKSPGILVMSIFLLFIILLFGFKFDMNYRDGSIEYIEFFLRIEAREMDALSYNVFRDMVGMFSAVIVFLLILQSSTLYPELINSSMIRLILSRNIKRNELLWSFYFSELFTVFTILMFFGIIITLIILIKSGGYITVLPIYICVIMFLIFVALFSIIAPVSILTKNSLLTTVFGIILFYLLIPLLMTDALSSIQFLKYIFPPALIERELYLKQDIEIIPIAVVSFIYAYLYIKLAIYLFEKMEIN